MPNRKNTGLIISSERYQQFCDYDIPFYGSIDDGKGTTVHIDSEVITNSGVSGDVMYYNKKITLTVDNVTHIVKKGDSLWALANKLGVSIDDIASSNNIKDVNKIRVGDVLSIDVDIKYGYQVNSAINLGAFDSKAKEQGYNPLSETSIYKVSDQIFSYVDNFGGSLAKNAGNARVGSNFRLYLEGSTGRVFHGNQYVNTHGLQNFGRKITKITQPLKIAGHRIPIIALAFEAVEIGDGIVLDGGRLGHNAQKQSVGAVGSIAGGAAGALAGAKIGTAAGALFGGIGAVPGFVVGIVLGAIGGYYGGKFGEELAEESYEKFIIE